MSLCRCVANVNKALQRARLSPCGNIRMTKNFLGDWTCNNLSDENPQGTPGPVTGPQGWRTRSLYRWYTFTGLHSSWIFSLSYILGFTGPKFRELSPCLLLVCLWTRYSLPSLSVSKTTSPQHKFRCSVQPLRPKCKILLSHTVFSSDCGELVPKTFFSKRISISFSERAAYLIDLVFFSSFCFAFNASLILVNSESVNSLCHICAL